MTPTDTEAINAVLRACEAVIVAYEGRSIINPYDEAVTAAITARRLAVDAWRAAGSPMVTVPDKEALLEAASLLEGLGNTAEVCIGDLRKMTDAEKQAVRNQYAVSAFLRGLAGER